MHFLFLFVGAASQPRSLLLEASIMKNELPDRSLFDLAWQAVSANLDDIHAVQGLDFVFVVFSAKLQTWLITRRLDYARNGREDISSSDFPLTPAAACLRNLLIFIAYCKEPIECDTSDVSPKHQICDTAHCWDFAKTRKRISTFFADQFIIVGLHTKNIVKTDE
jgi:hypothetical protein